MKTEFNFFLSFQENLVGTEKFPCRAFVYNAAKKECHLTADAGYTGRRGSSFNLKPISSGEYFEKYCLQVPIACLEASYEQVPDRTMTSKPYKDRCSLSETSQFSHPELFVKAENMDYFDKICDPVVLAKQRTESSAERDIVADGVASLALEPNEQHNVDDRVVGSRTDVVDLVRKGTRKETSLSLADVEEVSKAIGSVTSSSPSHDFKSNVVERKEALTEGIVIDDTADFLKEQKSPVKASKFCSM
nr:PAN-1 domain containing protein [Haemonchus contortus]